MTDLAIDAAELQTEIQSLFSAGGNCAESIFKPFAAALGHEPELMRLATPFGAGIGGRRDICGILAGGTMAIGLARGRTDPKDVEQKSLAYKAAARYYQWFKQQQKVRCSEIVKGKFTGHTEDCVKLMDGALTELARIIRGEA